MGKLILATERYYYYCKDDEHITMYDDNKKVLARGMMAIKNMLLELELVNEGSLRCQFRDDYMLDGFIAKYW